VPAVVGEDEDSRGNVAPTVIPISPEKPEPEWAPRADAAAETDVVEADVVQERETPAIVDGVEALAPAAAAKGRARSTRGRAPARARKSEPSATDVRPVEPRTRRQKEGTAARPEKAAARAKRVKGKE